MDLMQSTDLTEMSPVLLVLICVGACVCLVYTILSCGGFPASVTTVKILNKILLPFYTIPTFLPSTPLTPIPNP